VVIINQVHPLVISSSSSSCRVSSRRRRRRRLQQPLSYASNPLQQQPQNKASSMLIRLSTLSPDTQLPTCVLPSNLSSRLSNNNRLLLPLLLYIIAFCYWYEFSQVFFLQEHLRDTINNKIVVLVVCLLRVHGSIKGSGFMKAFLRFVSYHIFMMYEIVYEFVSGPPRSTTTHCWVGTNFLSVLCR